MKEKIEVIPLSDGLVFPIGNVCDCYEVGQGYRLEQMGRSIYLDKYPPMAAIVYALKKLV
jgi:hypothetical protein